MRKIKIGMFGRIVLAILVFLDDIDKTKAQESQDLKALIRRAAKYGLDTYLYSYIKAFAHPRDEADSRLGWEPSMEYCGGPEQIRWKLKLMDRLLSRLELQ